MAEEQEKDNTFKYVGGIIALAIIGVLILKGRETEHLQVGASTESTQAAFEAADAKRIAGKNVFE
ncbi:MAG: hypothetical protein GQ582_06150 [Methyloprofundus sp.]|nr:hypothetical protein [Methyloprofundus sp.]